MKEPCLELVVFKVKGTANARLARRAAQDTVRNYEGFISWTAYESVEDEGLFADMVLWQNLECAKKASEMVMKDPAFTAILAEIDGVLTISHYTADRVVEAQVAAA